MANQSFQAFSPIIWSPRIDGFFRAKLGAAKVFLDLSEDVVDGGDRVRIPKIDDNFTHSSINATSGDITSSSISDTRTQISINKWEGVALDFTDQQIAQVARQYSLKESYADTMAYTLARRLDAQLLSNDGSYDTSLGSSASDLTSTNFITAVEVLESNSVPRTEAWAFLHPRVFYGDLLQKQKIRDASQYGEPVLPGGTLATILGVRTFIAPNGLYTAGTGIRNQVVHPKAVVYALGNLPGGVRGGVRIQEIDRAGGSLKVKVVADILYGHGVLRSEAGVRLLAKNNR